MPTYEYLCEKCGVFEQFHSINTTLSHCDKCGAKVQRLISRNSNIIFKGSGFHTTDYRSGDYQKKATSETSGSNPVAPTTAKTDNSKAS